MSDVALDKAALISLVLETFNIGTFTILFGATVRIILKKNMIRTNGFLMPTVCLIWILSVAHWIIDIIRARIAFIDRVGEAIPYLGNIADPLEAAKTAVYVTVTVLADFFMIYRCFIVWNRQWLIVVLPILSWIATTVTGYRATSALLDSHNGVFVSSLAGWITSFFSLSLATNVICTGLIAFRIIRTQLSIFKHGTGTKQKSRVLPALAIFVESAAAYFCCLLALLICYTLNLNTQFIIIDITSTVIGITFTLIIFRLATQDPRTQGNTSYSQGNSFQRAAAAAAPPPSNAYALTSVHVSRLVEVERRSTSGEWGKGAQWDDSTSTAVAVAEDTKLGQVRHGHGGEAV